jgi:hypothetical protein
LTDDKNRSEVDAVIEEVRHELRSLFGRSKEQIRKVGNAFKKSGFKEESLCELIKNALKEEITEGLISSRSIELHCPPEWKHKTKPKNEKPSFSTQVKEKPQPKIAMTTEGKPVSYDEPTAYAETSTVDDSSFADPVQKLLSNSSDKQSGQECSSCLELQDKVIELSEALKQTSIQTADQIPATELEFRIPKEKYEMVRDAMDKSKDSICITCDESRTFVRAQPDVYN